MAMEPASDDGFFLMGRYDGSALFGKGDSVREITGSKTMRNSFVARYSNAGELIWLKNMALPGFLGKV
ncbi:MAG: hypothetical protein ACLFUS_16425 [Candidatus Sumerlaeia bacterium]